MISKFYDMGESGNANGLLAMVCMNAGFQIVTTYIKKRKVKKNKWRKILWEMLSIITLVQPGVDAHRVASGAKEAPGESISPLTAMALTKICELFFEAIPG